MTVVYHAQPPSRNMPCHQHLERLILLSATDRRRAFAVLCAGSVANHGYLPPRNNAKISISTFALTWHQPNGPSQLYPVALLVWFLYLPSSSYSISHAPSL
ncbi:hypothetical protein FIBSPDRAFT_866266 [Athelia psychrophila]|uniref:Uncharacterized protein n=1 Tax=Athelia psychrophila TaxID=1759441 RepID=A0A166EXL0_9AGAM|nr:hypothetical protein FIBSPDRAFT_866266 [Fibularhizoctonia sp. CBS 109695]